MRNVEVIVPNDYVAGAADWIARHIMRRLHERERVSVALSGGSTPGPVYERLASAVSDWSHVDLYFGDERCVAPDHEESTYRLVRETLLEHISGEPPSVFRMEGEDPDHDAAARRYEAQLPPGGIDLALQGMGGDAHTASLFPGHPALDERERRVVHVVGPKPPPDRLTMTPRALAEVGQFCMLVRGAAKANVIREVLEGPLDPIARPAQLVRDGAWILDEPAAAGLARPLPGASS